MKLEYSLFSHNVAGPGAGPAKSVHLRLCGVVRTGKQSEICFLGLRREARPNTSKVYRGP